MITNQNNPPNQTTTPLQQAYKLVLDDMVYNPNYSLNMFKGIYDAKNGSKSYMYGINTVLEYIAYRISDEEGDKFSEMFIQNLIESETKASQKKGN